MIVTGGTVVDSCGYRIHIFTASSTPGFNITSLGSGVAEVLVVAGGAAGGGGGGGAGGVRNFPYTFTASGSYPITVGGGGSPGGTEQPNQDAGDGSPSYISGPGGAIIFATGGGGGGMHDHTPHVGQTGGSGGGRAAIATGIEPGSATVASPMDYHQQFRVILVVEHTIMPEEMELLLVVAEQEVLVETEHHQQTELQELLVLAVSVFLFLGCHLLMEHLDHNQEDTLLAVVVALVGVMKVVTVEQVAVDLVDIIQE